MAVGFNACFLTLVIVGALALVVLESPARAADAPAARNLVAGLTAEFDPAPNYPDTIDANDALQLTDGIYSSGTNPAIEGVGSTSMWGQKSAVGWMNTVPLTIGFDLGTSQRIGGVSLSSAAGAAGVYWPRSIAMMVSDDKQRWRFAGELISLSRGNGLPQIQGYTAHRFVARNLHAQGRYLSFVVAVSGTLFFFTDEIEVYADTSHEPPVATGPNFDSMVEARKFVVENATRFGVQGRMARDYSTIRDELKAAKLAAPLRRELHTRLEAAATQIDTVPVLPAEDFRAVMPLNPPHAAMLKVHAALQSARGLPGFSVWKNHRYEYAEWLSAPSAKLPAPQLSVSLLEGEERGDAFWVGNASQHDALVHFTVASPTGARPGWLRLYQVPWVDTAQSAPMPCALVPLPANKGVYSLTLRAGLSTKIWCQFDGAALPPGEHRASLQVKAGTTNLRVPIKVQALALPALSEAKGARLGLRLWDYTDLKGSYGINPGNMRAAIALARSYGADMPEGGPLAVPTPSADDFDANDKIAKPLNFTDFDEWVARWPGAPGYTVFLNKQARQFAGAEMGTPAFDARVGAWGRALAEHMRSLGLRPEQLLLLVFDEPRTDEDDATAAGWIAAFKKGEPEIKIYSDPVWEDPNKSKHQEAFTLPHILCPNLQVWLRNKEVSEKFYGARQAARQELWLYQCTKESRLGDPTSYFRYQGWWAFRYGATSIGYWSLGDIGRALNSWNEYTGGSGFAFTPAFLDNDSALGTVQFEAIRDGMGDYRVFTLLKQAAAQTTNDKLKAEVAQLLSPESIEKVCGEDSSYYSWNASDNHSAADTFRERALELLVKLGGK